MGVEGEKKGGRKEELHMHRPHSGAEPCQCADHIVYLARWQIMETYSPRCSNMDLSSVSSMIFCTPAQKASEFFTSVSRELSSISFPAWDDNQGNSRGQQPGAREAGMSAAAVAMGAAGEAAGDGQREHLVAVGVN